MAQPTQQQIALIDSCVEEALAVAQRLHAHLSKYTQVLRDASADNDTLADWQKDSTRIAASVQNMTHWIRAWAHELRTNYAPYAAAGGCERFLRWTKDGTAIIQKMMDDMPNPTTPAEAIADCVRRKAMGEAVIDLGKYQWWDL